MFWVLSRTEKEKVHQPVLPEDIKENLCPDRMVDSINDGKELFQSPLHTISQKTKTILRQQPKAKMGCSCIPFFDSAKGGNRTHTPEGTRV